MECVCGNFCIYMIMSPMSPLFEVGGVGVYYILLYSITPPKNIKGGGGVTISGDII